MYISVLSWSRGWLRLQLEAYFKVKLINHLNILSEVFIFLNRTRRGQSTWKKLWQRHTCFTFRPGYHIFEHHKNLFSPPFLRPLAILVDLDCASWASISFWFWLKCAYVLGSAAHLGCTESMQSQCRLSRQLECVYWPIWKQFTWQAFIKLTNCTDSRQCFMLCASGYIAGTKYAVLAATDWATVVLAKAISSNSGYLLYSCYSCTDS